MAGNDYTLSGHGGARENSGRKPAGYQRPQEAVDFDKARARKEIAQAERIERENAQAEKTLVLRTAVQQAAATSYASLAQSLRSIPDELEREGVPPEVCRKVERIIEEAMAGHAATMELMSSKPEVPQ